MTEALLALLLVAPPPAGTYAVDASRSVVRYTVIHKLHEVDAASREIEGKAVVRDAATAVAQVRVPVASFRSGDANRDAHMIQAVEVGKFPFVGVKALVQLERPGSPPGEPLSAEVEVDFHGVKRRATIPLTVSRLPGGELRVQGRLDASLDAHGVERPSLLFVKVDDACRIDFDLVLRGEER